jgi:hypothetical protein
MEKLSESETWGNSGSTRDEIVIGNATNRPEHASRVMLETAAA